ncbi:MAG: DUF371 domain-containing protein [Candidatus Aenigmarchaeota archaeon]|nr:DUF371 domain-containing protein [Candidatus Aenigmarchaeota archaeon]
MARHEFEPTPEITPQMIREMFKVLDEKGMIYYTTEGAYVPTESGWKKLVSTKNVKEEIVAYGHPNITATHTTTFEITKSPELGKEGSCVIAVRANKACADLSDEFRNALKEARKLEITLEAGGVEDKIVAYGSPALRLSHPEDIVIRTSDFIDGRTLAILSSKSANEISQDLIEQLRKPETKLKITLELK